MKRPGPKPSPAIAARNREIVARYREGEAPSALARAYGLAPCTVLTIARRAGEPAQTTGLRLSRHVLRRVWAAATARPGSTIRELAAACAIGASQARDALTALAAAGYLARAPRRARGYTVIVPLLAGARVVAPEHPGLAATEAD